METGNLKGQTAIVLIIPLAICLAILGMFAASSPASAAPTTQETTPGTTGVITATVKACGECHLDVAATWDTSPHAHPEENLFDLEWDESGHADECLGCHTSNTQDAIGETIQIEVGCPACHAYTPEAHPPAGVITKSSSEECGACHATTFSQWRPSGHNSTEMVGCTACHDPHHQKSEYPTSNALCLNCHKDDPVLSEEHHLAHTEEDAACQDCHMYPYPGEREGHDGLDHSFSVNVDSCNECHTRLLVTAEVSGTVPLSSTEITVFVEPVSSTSFSTGSRSEMENQPKNVNSTGFIIAGGLVGIAAGMITSPWILKKIRQLPAPRITRIRKP